MTDVFNRDEFNAVYKNLVDHYRDEIRSILERKVKRINTIERKADKMSSNEASFVREEQALIQLLNDLFYLQEEAMGKLFDVFGAIKDQHFTAVNEGALMRERHSLQQSLIIHQQMQIDVLIQVIKNTIHK